MKSSRMGWAGHVARIVEKIAYRLLAGKPGRRGSQGRPRRRWIYNIKMDLIEVRCVGVDWIGLAQDRDKTLMNAAMNLRVP
jgi:hypothetical protein